MVSVGEDIMNIEEEIKNMNKTIDELEKIQTTNKKLLNKTHIVLLINAVLLFFIGILLIIK